MNEEIKEYVDSLFLNIPHSKEISELKKELLSNMSKNYEKYIQQGKNDDEAYQLVINDLKELDEMIIDRTSYE